MEEEHHTRERRAFPHSPPHPFRASVRSTIGCCATRPSFPNIPSPIHLAQAGLSAVAANAICSVKNMGIWYGRAIRTSRSLSLRSMWRAQPSWEECLWGFFFFFSFLSPSAASYFSCLLRDANQTHRYALLSTLFLLPRSTLFIIQMSNREDSVYLAKLAEQAERYEGTFFFRCYDTFISTR